MFAAGFAGNGREEQFSSPAREFALSHLDPFGGRARLQHRVRAEPAGVGEQQGHGAAQEGGLTIGILPGDNRLSANEYVKIPIVTGIGYARNMAVVKSAQAVIAIGGSYGTLSEIGHALQSGLPVIGIETWAVSRRGKDRSPLIEVKTPVEAVEKALELIGEV